jgi:NAD-dependent deacetylase
LTGLAVQVTFQRVARDGDTCPEHLIEEAAERIRRARHVVALTGAGLSVESGIPPFRGPGGIWTIHGEPPMDGYQRFLADPRAAWEERLAPKGPMLELWATLQRARPNAAHVALVALERLGVVRCTITQNVDDLHRAAGSEHLAEIHGNYRLVRCIECAIRTPREAIALDVLPPRCDVCGGILKNDTVSFGEPIPSDVLARCCAEIEQADCMLLVGTSATVYPAAYFPVQIQERGGELIEINPHPTELTELCATSLRGAAGDVLPRLQDAVADSREETEPS